MSIIVSMDVREVMYAPFPGRKLRRTYEVWATMDNGPDLLAGRFRARKRANELVGCLHTVKYEVHPPRYPGQPDIAWHDGGICMIAIDEPIWG